MSRAVTSPPGTTPWSNTSGATGINNTSSFPLIGANQTFYNYISALQAWNTHATVNTVIQILSNTTVIAVAYLPARTATFDSSPPDIHFDPPLKSAANCALNIQCVTTGANVFYNVQGFIGN